MALLSLRLGGFLVPGTAGDDLGNPGCMGRVKPAGNLRFGATPPASPPPTGAPLFVFVFMFMFMPAGEPDVRAPMFMRCSCKARALCMISDGRPAALGVGLLTVLNSPLTLELGLIWLEWSGSDTVLKEGIRRGSSPAGEKLGAASELALGGSSGVLAWEESSTEPGEAGLLVGRTSSAGVTGSELSAWPDIVPVPSRRRGRGGMAGGFGLPVA
jgi:hypothetical protein